MPPGLTLWTLLVLLVVPTPVVRADFVKQFRVTEGVPVGTRIGFIGAAEPGMSSSVTLYYQAKLRIRLSIIICIKKCLEIALVSSMFKVQVCVARETSCNLTVTVT